MKRRDFLRSTGAAAAGLTLLGAAAPPRADRPNILLVLADDMTWHDCAPYGSRQARTPHMAALARAGLCFDAMFTATAMCAPSRAQLYTGMYPVRNGAYPNHSRVYDGVRTLPHHLRALGYRVGLIGKTHFGPKPAFPFEILKPRSGAKDGIDPAAIAEFVNRDRAQPYCLVVASHEPHGPWTRGNAGAYPPASLIVPPYLVDCPETRDHLAYYFAEITYLDNQLGQCLRIVDESGRRDNTIVLFTSEQGSGVVQGGKWSCYERGLMTACIVRWPERVKAGARAAAMAQYVDLLPTLIEAAGGDPGAVETGRPDAQGRAGFDGRSLLGVLLGRTDKHRDYAYGLHTTRGIINGSPCYPVRSVRSDRYKYIRNLSHDAPFRNVVTENPDDLFQVWRKLGETDPFAAARVRLYQHRPAEELYDLERDPHELTNLAADPACAPIKQTLARELERWMAQQGDEGIATEMRANERQGKARQAAQEAD